MKMGRRRTQETTAPMVAVYVCLFMCMCEEVKVFGRWNLFVCGGGWLNVVQKC